MAYPPYLRARARELRTTKHLSLDEIAERLALPKTTVYYWIRDLPLGRRRRENPWKGAGRAQEKFRRLRDEAYARGKAEWDELVRLPTFKEFVALYIAEGYKRNRNRVSLGNSDERIVAMVAGWMAALTDSQLKYSVQYHADQDLNELRAFWGRALGIDGGVIRLQRKSDSSQLAGRTWRSAHGVLTVCADDTYLRARLQAWIDRIRQDWDLHSAQHAFGAWRSLVSRTVWGREIPGSNPGAPTSGDIARRFETGGSSWLQRPEPSQERRSTAQRSPSYPRDGVTVPTEPP